MPVSHIVLPPWPFTAPYIVNNITTQIGIRAVFALIILLVALAEGVGAEYILGAFLAGVVVSLLNPDEEMVI
jgi:Kef-type K+ transport system membrane component KefB